MNRVNVLIVEDEALVREGIHALLRKEEFIREIYEAGTASDFHEKMAVHRVDIILMDMRLRGTSGLELIAMLKKRPQCPKVIAVTGLEGIELVINLLKAGVNSVVFKLDGYKEIITAIRAVMEVGNYFQEKTLKIIQANAVHWDTTPPVVLSFLERELIRAIAGGGTTKEISQQLHISEATAETYRIRLIHKVGATNTAELLTFAFRNGIL